MCDQEPAEPSRTADDSLSDAGEAPPGGLDADDAALLDAPAVSVAGSAAGADGVVAPLGSRT